MTYDIHSSKGKNFTSINDIRIMLYALLLSVSFYSWKMGSCNAAAYYMGKNHKVYLSHVKVQIAASKKEIYLVWVYGITEYPLMLATNKKLQFKDHLIKIESFTFHDVLLCRYPHNSPYAIF